MENNIIHINSSIHLLNCTNCINHIGRLCKWRWSSTRRLCSHLKPQLTRANWSKIFLITFGTVRPSQCRNKPILLNIWIIIIITMTSFYYYVFSIFSHYYSICANFFWLERSHQSNFSVKSVNFLNYWTFCITLSNSECS